MKLTLLAGTALAALLAWPVLPAGAQTPPAWSTEGWVATFGKAPAGPPAEAATQVLTNQTVRLVVHTSVGGTRVRIRLSNEMGATTLRIGAAHVALRQSGAQISAGTDRVLTFGGSPSIDIPPGAPALSDPVDLTFAALADLVVSLHLPLATRITTLAASPLQTGYVSSAGDFTGAAVFPIAGTTSQWPFLTELDVTGSGASIVAVGDSITEGSRSTANTNNRWPDWLARRLQATPDLARLGVVNRGISGNRLLVGAGPGSLAGRNALDRFDRDVLATAGVRYLVVLLGINDIGYGSLITPATLVSGYRQLIARAHAKGIAVFGATLMPFQGAGYYSAQREATRQALNIWIRTGNELDGVIDFDQATRDPTNFLRLHPAYDSGDHLHLNNYGYQAMGNAVPLELFRLLGASTAQPPATEEAMAQ